MVNDSEDGGTDTVNKNSKAVDKLDEKDQAQERIHQKMKLS